MAKSTKRKRPVDRDARKPVSKDGGNGPERKRKPKDISASVHITHDDGDDLVELENRQFTAVTKALARQRTSKPKDHLAEFRAHVRLHDEELMVLYGKSNEDLLSHAVQSRSMMHAIISASLLNSISTVPALLPTNSVAGSQAANRESSTVLSLCMALTEGYDISTRAVKDTSTCASVGELWQKDCRDLKRQLEVGGKATKGRIQELLGIQGSGAKDLQREDPTTIDISNETDLVLRMGREDAASREEISTWATTAGQVKKNVRRLTRRLPA